MQDHLPPLQEDNEARRNFLKRAGQFAIYTPPAMLMLMHPSRKAIARTLGNNGVGNSVDPPPNGMPFQNGWSENDAPGFTPGSPGYQGGNPNVH